MLALVGAVVAFVAITFIVSIARGATVRPAFSPEYRARVSMENPSWRALRKRVFALTFGRDVLLPFLKADHLDHLTYGRLGREIPIVDVVPLSRRTHAVVTLLRRGGLRGPVNLTLRFAFLAWYAFGVYVVALALTILRIVHGVPLPMQLATQALTAITGICVELHHALDEAASLGSQRA